MRIPDKGALPQSSALLDRLFHGELVPREKKPQVIDTRRCAGPYLASIDDSPMITAERSSSSGVADWGQETSVSASP